ncbi:hypothetical protein [Halomonas sp.]|uniref:hypothetical protein n=1 Tax=Halomonas sp. TaxID=1486246 RepID=UPI003F928477
MLKAISGLFKALRSAAVAFDFDFRHEEYSARYFLENPGPTTVLPVARWHRRWITSFSGQ